jgi:cysteine synthase A
LLADVACSAAVGALDRDWICHAVNLIEADFHRSADTHLLKLPLSAFPDIDIYLKDESTHPTGSLKHRLARSLFLYGLCNGKIDRTTRIIEASSGSTAISEAYFAQLLGLPFTAVVPEGTSARKIREIEFFGGSCTYAPSISIYECAEQIAHESNGYCMDQFTFAERATDWRGNNIAESLFNQMQFEAHPVPE